ncbi:unnamed protein product [Closterium sp. NIES-64]|nr:unnamed protein product [Closterium sp. NIES-64]
MFQHIKDLVELDDSGPKAWKLLCDVIQPNTLPMQILQEDFRRRHTGGGAANKTAEGYGAAGGSRGRGGGRGRGRGRGFGRGRGRGDYMRGMGALVAGGVPEWRVRAGTARRLDTHEKQAKVTFGPTSCRAKLGKLLLWDLEEKSSCIKDLWQLHHPLKGKPPATAKAAAAAKATAGGEETAPTDGALDAIKKVQQPQQPHGEVLAVWMRHGQRLHLRVVRLMETWHERLCHVNILCCRSWLRMGA